MFNRSIENQDDYLEADDASVIVAAAEVVAKLLGKGTQNNASTAQVDEWVASVSFQPSSELLAKAHAALDIVLEDDSELNELLEETEDYEDWRSNIETLKTVLVA